MDPNQQPSPTPEAPAPEINAVPPTPEVAPTPVEPTPVVEATPVATPEVTAPTEATPVATDATPVTPVAAPVVPTGKNPGSGLGILSIVLLFFGLGLFSFIFGVIGLNKSKAAGFKNTPALIAVIFGLVEIIAILGLIVLYFTGALILSI